MWCCIIFMFLITCCCFFVFFKQKTAYEMRISDWSSDVCSSDLPAPDGLAATASCDGLFSTAVDLAWTGATPVRGYEIWRRGGSDRRQIGRASCRERVCQYV